MKARDALTLVVLAALWGASFLFMRMGARDFGPVALAAVRVAIASAVLLPLLLARGHAAVLRAHWRAVFVVGVLSSALPFVLFGGAALSLSAGLLSIFNATAPLWGALVAWLWLRDTLTPLRVAGLAIGFAGVVGLTWSQGDAGAGGGAAGWPIAAALGATLCYGIAASATKRHLTGVPAIALAAGSQFGAAAVLVVPALLAWPATPPPATAWWAAIGLGVLSTGLAYILYFQLIARVGPANAIAVTYLIPVFAMLWGGLFLGETVSGAMLAGGAVILAGTALATGFVGARTRTPRPAA
jgi:drug/metabolite transporter (DMT)-like permease